MQLVSLTVQNYRSITTAYKLPILQSTVLLGPNNEGKSNLLQALATAMHALTSIQGRPMPTKELGAIFPHHSLDEWERYDWRRDYPISLQDDHPSGESTITLEFKLSPVEVSAFKDEVGSALNEALPICIYFGPTHFRVKINKKGPGGKALTNKSRNIAGFVSQRLVFDYIPAVRTAESAERIVTEIVQRELQVVESDPKYKAALVEIQSIQEPVLKRLSASIQGTLKRFLPTVTAVEVRVATGARYRALRRSCEIVIDDGTPTLLQYKGDGAQSLAALGIMRHASERDAGDKSLIIAIEEPESHLHPKAIHALRDVIQELAQKHQVVITTHCPLFADRLKVRSNVIVQNRKARPAKNVEEVRSVLGVRSSDNLQHADLVLLVEGEDDRLSLSAILSASSNLLRSSLSNNVLAIDTLNGGGNLSYKVGLLRDGVCLCHCFLDHDKAGRDAFEKAKLIGLLTDAEVNFATCSGLPESEFEDLYDTSIYDDMLLKSYSVSLKSPKFRSKKKWSERMHDVFVHNGKSWNDDLEREVKIRIAKLAANSPETALNSHKRGPVQSLVETLERRLQELSEDREP